MNPPAGLPHLVAGEKDYTPCRWAFLQKNPELQRQDGDEPAGIESPAKAKTINKYLGFGPYRQQVDRALPWTCQRRQSVSVCPTSQRKRTRARQGEKGKAVAAKPQKPITLDDAKIFEPTPADCQGKGKVINDLRKSASTADAVYLAGDPDREGEAISAHLAMVLSKPM